MTLTEHDLRRWHPGETSLQEQRGFADDVFEGPGGITPGLLYGSASFLSQLQFLPLTTLDADGRPWVSLIAGSGGEEGFVQAEKDELGEDRVGVKGVRLPDGTPLAGHLAEMREGEGAEEMLTASVGVLLSNRRRNKYEGWIREARRVDDTEETWDIELGITASMGNCPKYINIRHLSPRPTKPQLLDARPTLPAASPLPPSIIKAIENTDTIYLGTRHTASPEAYGDRSKLGCNIRGGRSGFIQHHWDSERERHCLLLPDYSGNRFLQSLGNISGGDPVAGVTIPIFKEKGTDVLYLTCEAEVVSGEEARSLVRGVSGVTKLWVTGYSMIEGALPLGVTKQQGKEAVGWSPYNPILRYAGAKGSSTPSAVATLTDVAIHSPTLATFTWSCPISTGKSYRPGQHIICDASHLLDTRVTLYSHMAQFPGGEKDLNDDGTRSWTISRAWHDKGGEGKWHFTTTLRRVPRGGVTPTLFSMAQRITAAREEDSQAAMPSWAPKVPILGVDGEFTAADEQEAEGRGSVYVCSGIGVTPLLAHLSGKLREGQAVEEGKRDVLAIVACRADELEAMRGLVEDAARYAGSEEELRIHFLVKADEQDGEAAELKESTALSSRATAWHGARLTPSSFSDGGESNSDAGTFKIPSEALAGRIAYICGARPFEQAAKQALAAAGIVDIRTESFSY